LRRVISPRGLLLLLALAIGLFTAPLALGQASGVPAPVQAELITKLLPYDRNFEARAGAVVRTIVLVKPGSVRSRIAAEAFKSALSNLDRVGGHRHEERIVAYEGAAALVKQCKSERIAVVYVTPDFDGELDGLGRALSGVDVLTVSAVPDYVSRGVVLGFELVSGKPKILLDLPRAKRQNVDFSAAVLRLMKVYR
jgi:hypothetical protein